MSLNADKEVEFSNFSEVPEKCTKCIPNMQQGYTEVLGNGFVSFGSVLGLSGLCYTMRKGSTLMSPLGALALAPGLGELDLLKARASC